MKTNFPRMPSPTPARRVFFFVFSDVVIILASLYLSFQLRFDFRIPVLYEPVMRSAAPFFLLVKLALLALYRVYRITWRYAGLHDLMNVAKASLFSAALLFALVSGLTRVFGYPHLAGFPRSVFLIDWAVSFILLTGLRTSRRIFLEAFGGKRGGKGVPTVIAGAGNVGEAVLRDIIRNKFAEFYPLAFLDDDPQKIGWDIHGVRVAGTLEELREVVLRLKAQAVIIAIPTLSYRELRRIYSQSREAKVKTVKIVPGIYSRDKPDLNIKKLEEISIEDIIGRQNVKIDFAEIEEFLKGKRVLVTGAGGSIGSELSMQAMSFGPESLALLDNDETELHGLRIKFEKNFEGPAPKLSFVVADICDLRRMEEVFREFRPHVVFHSAAYKHVPVMEENPGEAVRVNILGTAAAAACAAKSGAERFILISTDKAVRPKSVMGATKKIAENICRARDSRDGCNFVSVRFGNVLGSRGSILPLFLEQLKSGGPLTVTHRDMKRYFMTIPEAVALVLQASVIGRGGDIMVLDMGEPVKIVSLAEDLIRLHGLRPYEDIEIEFTGVRPGENLFEEILTADEKATRHEKIFVAGGTKGLSRAETDKMLDEFEKALDGGDARIRELLSRYAGGV